MFCIHGEQEGCVSQIAHIDLAVFQENDVLVFLPLQRFRQQGAQADDFFLLKRDKSSLAVHIPNLIIWVIGFVVYRILMNIDMPLGNTLPDMVITIVICLIVGKFVS